MLRNGGKASTSSGTEGDSIVNSAALTDHSLTIVPISAIRKSRSPVGVIYYVSYGEAGPVKIGFVNDRHALGERLRGLQTACPYPLILLAARVGSTFDERELHRRFAGKRLSGEWFERHPALMQHVAGRARSNECRSIVASHGRYALAK